MGVWKGLAGLWKVVVGGHQLDSVTASIPATQTPGVFVLLVVLSLHRSFTRDLWEGDAQGGEDHPPPTTTTSSWTRGEADAAQRLQLPKEPAHSHGLGQLWGWRPPGPKTKHVWCLPTLSLLLPGRPVPPVFARGRAMAKTHEPRQRGCWYPPSRSAGLLHGQGSVRLPRNNTLSNLDQFYFADCLNIG